MKRFAISEWENEDGQMEQGGLEEDAVFGEYVLYEDVEPIVADRDIKAANLQLLVENVLMWEVQDSAFQVAPELTPHFNELFALARSLKQ